MNQDGAGALWQSYHGRPNTLSLLDEKAELVARLIGSNLDSGLVLAAPLKEKIPSIRLGEPFSHLAFTETAILLVVVSLEIASSVLDVEGLRAFQESLSKSVAGTLKDRGVQAAGFSELLSERRVEYAAYRKRVATGADSAKDTLFWEFGKKLSVILAVGKNAIYLELLANLLLEAVHSWQLRDLLME